MCLRFVSMHYFKFLALFVLLLLSFVSFPRLTKADAGDWYLFPYEQLNSSAMINDYDASTDVKTYFALTGTTTIHSITFSIAAECTNTGVYPSVNLYTSDLVAGAHDHRTAAVTITGDSQTNYTFTWASGVTVSAANCTTPDECYLKLEVSTCSQKPRFYGFDNTYATTTEISFKEGASWSDELPYFHVYSEGTGDVTVEELPDSDTDIYVLDPSLTEGTCSTTPCAKLVNTPKYCYYDIATTSCTLDFQYNRWASGATAYLVEPGGLPPGDDSWYLVHTDYGGYDQHLDIPNPGYATSTEYNLFLDITDYGGYRLGAYEVEWAAYCDIGNNCPGSPYYTSNRCHCDNVATSSLEWWDPTSYAGAFRYAVECGAIKAGCYLLTPDPNSYDYVIEQEYAMKQKFPLSLFYDISSTTNSIKNATATPALIEIAGMPTSLNGLNGLKLLDLSDVETNSAYPLISVLREILLFILRILVGLYIIARIIMLSRRDKLATEQ